jgi:hypothetical protein
MYKKIINPTIGDAVAPTLTPQERDSHRNEISEQTNQFLIDTPAIRN